MFVGGFGYTLYSAQMLYLSNWWALSISINEEIIRFLYGSAVLNGLGAAMLWTSQVGRKKERKEIHIKDRCSTVILKVGLDGSLGGMRYLGTDHLRR